MTPDARGFSGTGGDGRVGFCFGVARRTDLPGPVLVRMLADLGVGNSAARSRIARLVARGSLIATRRGRLAHYRIAGPFAVAYARSDRFAPLQPSWDGELHGLLVSVAEDVRSFRDTFRRQAVLVGYGQLRPGLFIAPQDRSEPLADLIAQAPARASVIATRLRLTPHDSRIAAAQAWGLDAVAERYRRLTVSINAALARHVNAPPSGATLAAFADLVEETFVQFAADPGLPAQLLPPDWPRDDLAAALERAANQFGPVCGVYVAQLIAEADGGR